MSGVFDSVMAELSTGATARSAARTLGISLDLAEAIADEATRMGLIVSGSAACGTCVPKSSPACAGCPFAEDSLAKSAPCTSTPPSNGPTPVTLMTGPQSR